jgi:flagellar protein FlgJ
MSLIHPATISAGTKPDLGTTVQHMGLSADTLGTGGDDFQGMFLWNIAQNDFGKYDSALTGAMLRQVGGQPDVPPAAVAAPVAEPDFSSPLLQDLQLGGSGDAGAMAQAAAVSAAPEVAPPAGKLLAQAKTYAAAIWPQITAAAQTLGVPAIAVLAQSALETGWGAAAPGHNLFGIKAADGEPGTARATHEMIDGVLTPQTASFRDYGSTAQSISDYVNLIQAGFPDAAGQGSVFGFANALQQGGYATDGSYAAKIAGIAQSPLMAAVLKSLHATTSEKATP